MWSVSTIITGLISFMVEKAPTLGSIKTSDAQKKKYARTSLDWNVKDKTFQQLFPDLVVLQKQKLEERRLKNPHTSGNGNSGNTSSTSSDDLNLGVHEMEMQGMMAAMAGLFAILSIMFAMRFI